eukprot:12364-Eustigmatos_ZCMA.PRE.1
MNISSTDVHNRSSHGKSLPFVVDHPHVIPRCVCTAAPPESLRRASCAGADARSLPRHPLFAS